MINKLLFVLLLLAISTSGYCQPAWTNQYSGVNVGLNSVTFLNTNTGYVAGAFGTILKTSNGGVNWIAQGCGSTDTIFSMHFINASTGTLIGANGLIRRTTNGGATWSTQTCGSSGTLRALQFLNSYTG